MKQKHKPVISGFVDFLQYHADGTPFYMHDGCLCSGFDLLVPLATRYNFTGPEVKAEIEQAIKQNLYYFDVEPSSAFFWPNTNMFSSPCSLEHERGEIYTVKEKYRKQWR